MHIVHPLYLPHGKMLHIKYLKNTIEFIIVTFIVRKTVEASATQLLKETQCVTQYNSKWLVGARSVLDLSSTHSSPSLPTALLCHTGQRDPQHVLHM